MALTIGLTYSYTDAFTPLKQRAVDWAFPVYWLADVPLRVKEWGAGRFGSKQALLEENETLRTELLIHKRRTQQMAALVAENTRLRQLLNSADTIAERVLVAELVGVSPNPMKHQVMINRGASDGVYEGQPVVDAHGLVGQVVIVGRSSSRVLLITDSSHALPVQVNRNGVRLVAEGQGNLLQLRLRHVSNTLDIHEGDLLVTSGLGQRFPAGYPVGLVDRVEHDPGRPFADVYATPMADLNRNRHVLLVFERNAQTSDDLHDEAR